jgi:hypothetical protein
VDVQGGRSAIVPLWLLLSEDVTPKAMRLYGLLSALYGGSGLPDPCKSELAVLMGVGIDTLESYLRQLVEVGALHKLPIVYADGAPTPRRFVLRSDPPEEALAIPGVASADPEFVRAIVADRPRIFTPSAKSQRESSTSSTVVPKSKKLKHSHPDTINTNAVLRYPRFVEFWREYPRSEARDRALRRWIQLKAERNQHLYGAIMTGLERAKDRWRREERTARYIPFAATWIKEKGWLDHTTEAAPVADETIWGAISAEVEQRVDRHCYRSWFAGAKQIANGDGTITVSVVSAAWVTKHYTQIVAASAESAGHAGVKITWEDQVGAGVVGNPV